MTTATLEVRSAGPLVSIQDAGRPGHVRHGVPGGGPMDRLAFAVANAVLRNAPDAAGIEVSVGGLSVRCVDAPITVAVCGGGFAVEIDGAPQSAWCVRTLHPGERLSVRPGPWGSWAYLAVAGSLRSPRWLGSASTHTVSGFGGGLVETGMHLVIDDARSSRDADGEIDVPAGGRPAERARVVLGPQAHRFDPTVVERFLDGVYRATAAFDRMGVRLDGPSLQLGEVLSIPSEAILRGAVQVAGDGVATVLLADHQTTGGYPKIATVIGADVDRIAQLRPGEPVRFVPVSPEQAVAASREWAAVAEATLQAARRPGRTLEQRLRQQNLVDGLVSTTEVDGDE